MIPRANHEHKRRIISVEKEKVPKPGIWYQILPECSYLVLWLVEGGGILGAPFSSLHFCGSYREKVVN